jgi:hypothetical protein
MPIFANTGYETLVCFHETIRTHRPLIIFERIG